MKILNTSTAATNYTVHCTWLLQPQELVVYGTLNILFSCLTITGNLVFLLAIARSPNLHTVSNFFLCSLSIADLSSGLFVFPLYTVIALVGVSPSGVWVSTVEKFVFIQTLVASTFSLAMVSVDRYVAVLHPLKYYALVTEKRCVRIIVSVWILSIVLAFPAPFLNGSELAITWAAGGIIAVIFPFGIISFCYFHIFKAVRRQSKTHCQEAALPSVSSGVEFSQNRISRRKHQKAAFTSAIVVGLFVILFSPNLVFAFMYAMEVEGSCDQVKILHPWLWGVLVAYSGSFVNPWIYGLRTTEVRNVFKQMFKCM